MTKGKSNHAGTKVTENTKSREELQQEINLTLARLQQGVQDVFSSNNYKHYLQFFAKMHNYSFNNTILILSQLPTASLCASYQTWKSVKCPVRRGQTGIKILVPVPYKTEMLVDCKDPQGNIVFNADGTPRQQKVFVERTAFRLGNVFDISQVDGDVPSLTQELKGTKEGFAKALNELMTNSDIPIVYDTDLYGTGTNGYYHVKENRIALRSGMSVNQCMKTLIHEKAHSLLHNGKGAKYSRNEAEVQAESIAYVVSEVLGLDTSDYSFGYIASWSKNKELIELQHSISVIDKTSKEILKWIADNSSLTITTPLQAA